MLELLSDQIRRCYERAAQAREKAEATNDPVLKTEFLMAERRWLTLARSYGFTESLANFIVANSEQRRKFDEHLQQSSSLVANVRKNLDALDDIISTLPIQEDNLGSLYKRILDTVMSLMSFTERALWRLDVLARQQNADLTERGKTQAALRETNDKLVWLAAIIENSDDAIITKNLDSIISSWNKSAEQLFGYTAEEVIGKSITILIPTDRPDEEPAILARIRSGERMDHYETIRQRKDGSLIDISLTVSPIKNVQGEIIGASEIARDITERKRND